MLLFPLITINYLRHLNSAFPPSAIIQISDEDFKLWATHYPDSQQGDCVRMAKCDSCESKVAWYNEFCGMDLVYTCQTLACSTDHYCPVIR
ncbi:hypothetical protein Y032_0023g790 [Ancylostoma ceylanicum]|uniref:Uncharacterized protein n=1 Tax=Ancylostoma ceylanicum TaxID=53326 RepID=A0A016UY45_9BILA|nr:hypothetical protein Y032_0023g790 [Ancylostoma ceylanicum]